MGLQRVPRPLARDPVRRLGRRLLRAGRERSSSSEGLDPLVTMEVFTRQDAVLCGIDEAKNLLGHVLADGRPDRDPARGARRRRPDRAQGDRPPHPGALSPVRPVRDGVPRDARPVDRLGHGGPRVRRRRRARAGHQLRRPPRPPGHHRRPRLRGDRRRLRRRLDAGRRPPGRPRADRHDAPLAGPDLRRHGGGGPGVRPRTSGPRCRGSCSSTRSRTRPRRRSASPTRSATGCTASASTRPSERGRVTADLVHEVRARLDQAGFQHVRIVVSGGLNPGPDPLLQGGRRAGRLVRGRARTSAARRRSTSRATSRRSTAQPIAKRGRIPGLTDSPRLKPVDLAAYREGLSAGASGRDSRTVRDGRTSMGDVRRRRRATIRADGPSDDERAYDLLQRGHAAARAPPPRAGRDRARAGRRLEPGKRLDPRGARPGVLQLRPDERARETFERAARGRPVRRTTRHYALGQSLKRLGRRKEAGTHLRLAVALSPRIDALPRRPGAARDQARPAPTVRARTPGQRLGRVRPSARRAGRASQKSPTSDFASRISPRSAAAQASRQGIRSGQSRSSSSGPRRPRAAGRRSVAR